MSTDIFTSLLSSERHLGATPLTKAGSNRQYYRLDSQPTLIGVIGTSREENHAFIAMAQHFERQGLNSPRIVAVSDDEMAYIQEDLGNDCLYAHLGDVSLLEKTLSLLPRFQTLAAEGMDWSVCYPQPEFDRRNILFDLNYFKYDYLKLVGADFHEGRLEDDFQRLADDLLSDSGPWGFMIRDFQSRNVMLRDGQPYFIDFQGGRRGPLLYDVASFLWQASARFSPALREHLIDVYAESLAQCQGHSGDLRRPLRLLALFRTLQVLGAYGFRGIYERKPHFLASIAPALDNLSAMGDALTPYPELAQVAERLCANRRSEAAAPAGSPLTVRVFSFSYKRGIPADSSGNGGGYVFDCRSTHNPGRYEPYKQLTGLDQPVIDFLEKDGEILTFLDSVYRLADAHVERYIERGFTDLMFAFGCTGGQHRSVYSAQHLAEHLNQKYNIRVALEHREQNIKTTLNPKQ